jgi:hypothetical protein
VIPGVQIGQVRFAAVRTAALSAMPVVDEVPR